VHQTDSDCPCRPAGTRHFSIYNYPDPTHSAPIYLDSQTPTPGFPVLFLSPSPLFRPPRPYIISLSHFWRSDCLLHVSVFSHHTLMDFERSLKPRSITPRPFSRPPPPPPPPPMTRSYSVVPLLFLFLVSVSSPSCPLLSESFYLPPNRSPPLPPALMLSFPSCCAFPPQRAPNPSRPLLPPLTSVPDFQHGRQIPTSLIFYQSSSSTVS